MIIIDDNNNNYNNNHNHNHSTNGCFALNVDLWGGEQSDKTLFLLLFRCCSGSWMSWTTNRKLEMASESEVTHAKATPAIASCVAASQLDQPYAWPLLTSDVINMLMFVPCFMLACFYACSWDGGLKDTGRGYPGAESVLAVYEQVR